MKRLTILLTALLSAALCTAPALAAICWTDAPITAAGAENDRTRVTYERTLCGRRLTVDTWLENGLPISAQVCYNQQCILKLEVSEFYMK